MYHLLSCVVMYTMMIGLPATFIYGIVYMTKFMLSGELIIREEPQQLEAE